MNALFSSRGPSFQWDIKSKRAGFSIKLYQLCTSNGILLDFVIYHKNITLHLTAMEEGIKITERIQATLMDRYFCTCHILHIDNFYTSLGLVRDPCSGWHKCHRNYQRKKKTFFTWTKEHNVAESKAIPYQHDSIVILKYRAKGIVLENNLK